MRTIDSHKINRCNEQLEVTAVDGPGSGGASHHYRIHHPDEEARKRFTFSLYFQSGPIGEFGVNGLTHEALLAVLIDRLESFQAGAFACVENEAALASLREALGWLHKRTERRLDEGVEGTHQL